MDRVYRSLASVAICLCTGITEVCAEGGRVEKYLQAGQQAVESGDWTKAEANYSRALKDLESTGSISDQTYANVLKRLAQSCRHNQKYADAGQYLNRAIAICRAIGFADPEVNSEFLELSKECKIVDLDKLGTGSANTLKANSAVMTVVKSGPGYAVAIDSPQRLEKTLNSDKIDQIGLEKECTFKIEEDADGTVRASEIKGFKIHSVEKNMWVNLLGCTFGPADAQGNHESIISAGKMGVVKNVNSRIAPRTYEPVGGIIASIREMGHTVVPPLVIAGTASPATVTSPISAPSVDSLAPAHALSEPAPGSEASSVPNRSNGSEKVSSPGTAPGAGLLDKAARQAAAQAALEKAGEEKEAAERDAARAALKNAGALRSGRSSAPKEPSNSRDEQAEISIDSDLSESPRNMGATSDSKRSSGALDGNREPFEQPESRKQKRTSRSDRNDDDDDDDDEDDDEDDDDKRLELEKKERREREREKHSEPDND